MKKTLLRLALGVSVAVSAETYTWTGGVSSDFATGGNWAGGVAPDAMDADIDLVRRRYAHGCLALRSHLVFFHR